MKKFDGLKLLVLGSNVSATDIVKYARENGAHVIVADYLAPEKSAAKPLANETALISTADIEALDALIKERKIDGVLAGISEFNLLKAMELAEKNNLPFYCNLDQWHAIEDKGQFRRLCEANGVPCPKTYFVGSELNPEEVAKYPYPAVLKPVDASTSAGVYICEDAETLLSKADDSLSKSKSGNLIIEEFIDGYEFTAHYSVVNGEVALSCVDNRYPVSVHEGNVTTVPVARIYPCLFLDEYIAQADESIIRMIKSLGVKDAIIFVQGLYNPTSNRFCIFEAGLRCAGEAPYRFIERVNHVNPIHILVDHALLGSSDYKLELEDPYLQGKCCGTISFVTYGGKVGEIVGLEETVEHVKSVVAFESRYPKGAVAPDGDTLRQLMIRFIMVCDSREAMVADVAYINEHTFAYDENGKNMVIKMEPERVLDYK